MNRYSLVVLLIFLNLCGYAQQPVIITYVGGYRGNLIDTRKIEAARLTHVLYAFADLKNNRAYLHYPNSDVINLNRLTALRKTNPGLKILLSVGGQGWSRNFSGMALTADGRRTFAQSCTRLLRQFKLDGIDIDWEFPGYAGQGGNIYRPRDKVNYTLMFKALRIAFDELGHQDNKRYQLTVAVDGWAARFLPHTQMAEVQNEVDYVCVMSYHFNTPQLAGGPYLYSPAGWDAAGSADGAIRAFIQAGVPKSKLVIGAGFFPVILQMRSNADSDRNYVRKIQFRGGLGKVYRLNEANGYQRYWDKEGKAPYLFNPGTHIRIAYEDTASVNAKCDYLLQRKLAGIMYWDYFSDPGRKLLHAINGKFRPKN
ncbi:MAG: Chitinase [Mucilaginibacter sp.]|nr:Chitinase [Mucilaginibacter sp.]